MHPREPLVERLGGQYVSSRFFGNKSRLIDGHRHRCARRRSADRALQLESRGSRRLQKHKALQVGLALLLAVVVGLFEYNLRLQGGIFEATKASGYAGTATLDFWIYFHTFFAITTIVIWGGLIVLSLRKFPSPPSPGAFSATHRRWGRLGMIWMLVTGVTSLPVYLYGFAL